MATNKGSSGVVKIAASGGSAAVVGEVRSYSIDTTADTVEDTVMGDTARTYLPRLVQAQARNTTQVAALSLLRQSLHRLTAW